MVITAIWNVFQQSTHKQQARAVTVLQHICFTVQCITKTAFQSVQYGNTSHTICYSRLCKKYRKTNLTLLHDYKKRGSEHLKSCHSNTSTSQPFLRAVPEKARKCSRSDHCVSEINCVCNVLQNGINGCKSQRRNPPFYPLHTPAQNGVRLADRGETL